MSKEIPYSFVIKTPLGEMLASDVKSIALTTEGGDIQCFANHASLTASIAFTPVLIDFGQHTETYMVRNGMFMFDNKTGGASLLVLSAEKKSEMKMETVKEYHEFIIDKMKNGEDLSEFQIKYLEGEKLAVEQQLEMV